MQERKPRKPKNYGQQPLPSLEAQIEAEATKNERPVGMPSLGMVKTYTSSLGLTDQDAEQIYDSWLASGYKLRTGHKIRDWKAVVRTWHRSGGFLSQKKAAAATQSLAEKEEQRKAAIRRMRHGS